MDSKSLYYRHNIGNIVQTILFVIVISLCILLNYYKSIKYLWNRFSLDIVHSLYWLHSILARRKYMCYSEGNYEVHLYAYKKKLSVLMVPMILPNGRNNQNSYEIWNHVIRHWSYSTARLWLHLSDCVALQTLLFHPILQTIFNFSILSIDKIFQIVCTFFHNST